MKENHIWLERCQLIQEYRAGNCLEIPTHERFDGEANGLLRIGGRPFEGKGDLVATSDQSINEPGKVGFDASKQALIGCHDRNSHGTTLPRSALLDERMPQGTDDSRSRLVSAPLS